MDEVPAVALDADREWSELTGRGYGVIERYRCEGAAHRHRDDGQHVRHRARRGRRACATTGQAVGLLKVRLFRPLPVQALRAALAGVPDVLVLDRNYSPGHGGVLHQELRAALYGMPGAPRDPRLPRRRGRRQRLAGEDRRVRPHGAARAKPRRNRSGSGDANAKARTAGQDDAVLGPRGVSRAASMRCRCGTCSPRSGPKTMAIVPPSCMAIIAGPAALQLAQDPRLPADARGERGRGHRACAARSTRAASATRRSSCSPATAAPTTSASSACRRRPSATRTSSTSASTTKAT